MKHCSQFCPFTYSHATEAPDHILYSLYIFYLSFFLFHWYSVEEMTRPSFPEPLWKLNTVLPFEILVHSLDALVTLDGADAH